jgi:hypothetical protein
MTNIRNIIKYVVFVIMLALLLVCPVSAGQDGGSSGGHQGSGRQGSGRQGSGHQASGYHSSGHQGRYYGGYHGSYGYHYGHYGYWYGGWWFPWVGIIPYLPADYQTMWIDGYPYYYADGDYYAPTTNGYMVVDPQSQAVPPETGQQSTVELSTKLFIYPRNGQSEKQQAEDRYQCDRWAVGQTGYDPTKPASGMSEIQLNQMRSDFKRAMGACLDGRGYSMR